MGLSEHALMRSGPGGRGGAARCVHSAVSSLMMQAFPLTRHADHRPLARTLAFNAQRAGETLAQKKFSLVMGLSEHTSRTGDCGGAGGGVGHSAAS